MKFIFRKGDDSCSKMTQKSTDAESSARQDRGGSYETVVFIVVNAFYLLL